MKNPISLPSQVPVMPLPGAVLFPHALLPLYIFEDRYRAMLKHALAHDRMFSIVSLKPGCAVWRSPNDFFAIASVGLVRACVGRADGTSNLILQGLQRVRFTDFEQVHPFPIAAIDPLESDEAAGVQLDALGTKLLEIYAQLKQSGRQFSEKVDRYLCDLSDPEMLADLMASTFITDTSRRQQMLEELDLAKRLRLAIQYLREETGSAAA